MLNRLLEYKIENILIKKARLHADTFKLFFNILLINIFVYGQKIFSQVLATDDYARFYHGGGEQASWLGRWMGGIINEYLFTGAIHVLPYLNGIIGIFFITLAAFSTALFFKRKKNFEILIVTLIISTLPFIAHNLYFNTNVGVWITTALGVIGLIQLYSPKTYRKIIGLIFLIIAIGTYQTIIQVSLSIILIRLIVDIHEEKEKTFWQHLLHVLFIISLLSLAFISSIIINYIYIDMNNLSINRRLETASQIQSISVYTQRLFYTSLGLKYFNSLYNLLLILSALAGISSAYIIILKRYSSKLLASMVSIVLILSIFIIIQLPTLTGNGIPTRAHYTINWLLAGLFVLHSITYKGIFKSTANIISIILIIVNIYYINVFFYAGKRQMDADTQRASQIVNRIRINEHYLHEPISFKIVGTSNIANVIGWHHGQALSTDWSKYNIFKYFTDLQFTQMSSKDYQKLMQLIKKNKIDIQPYPGKNSIIVDENNVILFFNQPID